jgi:hypothetical protein
VDKLSFQNYIHLVYDLNGVAMNLPSIFFIPSVTADPQEVCEGMLVRLYISRFHLSENVSVVSTSPFSTNPDKSASHET